MAKIQVEPSGDIELWLVSGKLPDDSPFTLPLKLRPYRSDQTTFYRTPVAQYMNAAQYAQLSAICDAWDQAPGDEKYWWFSAETLQKFAVKASGINPEAYVVWPGWEKLAPRDEDDDSAEIATDEPDFSSAELTLLRHLHQITGVTDWTTLKVIWLNLRKYVINQLAEDQRAVDLGFVRLIPVPYRINWKEALAVRFGTMLHAFKRPNGEREEILREQGFYGALTSVQLLAIDRDKNFAHWSIECLPSDNLARALEEHEYRRFKSASRGSYANMVLNRIARRFRTIMEIFGSYTKRVSIPLGQKVEAGFGNPIIRPAIKPGRIAAGGGLCKTIELRPDAAFGELRDIDQPSTHQPSTPAITDDPDEFVKELPALKQPLIGRW